MDIAGTGINDIFAEFESHWIGREVEGEQYLPAESAFFRGIVSGVVEAQKALWQAHRQLVEPAGATALAALMSGAYVPARGERVAVLVCGANPAPDPLA